MLIAEKLNANAILPILLIGFQDLILRHKKRRSAKHRNPPLMAGEEDFREFQAADTSKREKSLRS